MSNFGELLRRLRREQGFSLRTVARKLNTQKGYLSGIENGKVNPPSAKLVKRIAQLYRQDERMLLRLAWADKAPSLIREDAVRMVSSVDLEEDASPELISVRLLNPEGQPYPAELGPDGTPRSFDNARLVLPRCRPAPDFAAIITDDSMDREQWPRYRRGDVVFLSKIAKVDRSTMAYVVYQTRGGVRATIRQAVPEKDGALVLQPLDERSPLEFLEPDQIGAIYRVVGRIEMFVAGLTA
ncbi:MAG: helix-turn-helix domain-containing protein [Planctomycetaceae bacterium]|nr:helix-turn-helix domain-containing protein [Planctomycetaceae bacterium]